MLDLKNINAPLVPLKEFAAVERGGTLQKRDLIERGVPALHYGQIYTKLDTFFEEPLTFVSPDLMKQRVAHSGDLIMAVTSENVEDVCKTVAWLGNTDIAVSGHTAIIHHNENPKYLSYFFNSMSFYRQKLKLVQGTKVVEVSPRKLEDILVPLPSRDVQNQIASCLDNFKKLTQELTQELTLRQKQYEYYRDYLLSDEVLQKLSNGLGGAKRVKFGKYIKIKNGKDYKKLSKGSIPVFGSGGIMCYVDAYLYDKPSVLIPRKGSLDNIFYTEGPFWNVDTIFYTEIDTEHVLPKYIYYLMNILKPSTLNQAGGVPSMTQSKLNAIEYTLPPLSIQKLIVEKLDAMSTLCASITEGLPAEIEARKKQYEYYRDKLLSFESVA